MGEPGLDMGGGVARWSGCRASPSRTAVTLTDGERGQGGFLQEMETDTGLAVQ